MNAVVDQKRYAGAIEASKRVSWDIERDVIRGRRFDLTKSFLPDGLSKISELPFLSPSEKRFLSQIQGRTYSNMFGLIERYVLAKALELTEGHRFGDQVALEAMLRFTDEELKHQALFRRVEQMIAPGMPAGYKFEHDANGVAQFVLGKSSWAVLALTLNIEIVTQAHYRSSIEPEADLCALWKDVFLFHWKEESQHAILDELEWRREAKKVNDAQRDRAVNELIELVAAVDGIVQAQAKADAAYFLANAGHKFSPSEQQAVHDLILGAYRWQYIGSGVEQARFTDVLKELTTPAQMERIGAALAPILAPVTA